MKDEEFEISSLLKSKDFEALNTEEQAFVLSEFGSREKYQAMRVVLMDQSSSPDIILPIEMRNDVMNSFDAFHSKKERRIGLWIPERTWYRQPVMIALAAASVLIAIFLILPHTGENLNRAKIAENKPLKKETSKTLIDKLDSVKSLERFDKQKDKERSEEVETNQKELRPARLSIAQAKTSKVDTDDNASARDLDLEPIPKTPVSNDLQSLADGAPSFAEISIEENINSSAADSNMGVVQNNQNLVQAKVYAQESRRRHSNATLEKEESESSETNMKLYNLNASKESKTAIFLLDRPLPDHYVAY